MIQEILAATLILAAIISAAYLIYKRFFRDESPCDSCAHKDNCGSCTLQDLKKDINPEILEELERQKNSIMKKPAGKLVK